MKPRTPYGGPVASLVLAAALSAAQCGCAAYRAYEKCGLHGCPGDQQISAAVRARLAGDASMLAPNLIYVQTLDGVVYLSGQVATDLQRASAEQLARDARGVRKVVNIIAIMDNNSR